MDQRIDNLPDEQLIKNITDIESELLELKNKQFTASASMQFFNLDSPNKTDIVFAMANDPMNPGGTRLGIKMIFTAKNTLNLFTDEMVTMYYNNNTTLWDPKDYYNFSTNYVLSKYVDNVNGADPHINVYDIIVFGNTIGDNVGLKFNAVTSDHTTLTVSRFW